MLGRSLWSDGRLAVLGEPVPFYSLLHPLLIGLPLELWDGLTGYRVAQALGAIAMAATALPVFAWGRTLMRPGWALVAAVLTVAIPALALSGLLMTETLFYPLATLAAWALAVALERPTLARQALLVGAILLTCATRLQGVVFLPVVVTAAVAFGVLVRSPRTALRLWPSAAALGAVGLLWAGWRIARDGGAAGVLAGYRDAADRSLAPADALVDIVRHLGGVVWVVGLVPVVALVALLVLARREAAGPSATRRCLQWPARSPSGSGSRSGCSRRTTSSTSPSATSSPRRRRSSSFSAAGSTSALPGGAASSRRAAFAAVALVAADSARLVGRPDSDPERAELRDPRPDLGPGALRLGRRGGPGRARRAPAATSARGRARRARRRRSRPGPSPRRTRPSPRRGSSTTGCSPPTAPGSTAPARADRVPLRRRGRTGTASGSSRSGTGGSRPS